VDSHSLSAEGNEKSLGNVKVQEREERTIELPNDALDDASRNGRGLPLPASFSASAVPVVSTDNAACLPSNGKGWGGGDEEKRGEARRDIESDTQRQNIVLKDPEQM
jgi:hypothetical protein